MDLALGRNILILLFFHCSWVLTKAKREINWDVPNKGSEICWDCTVCPLLRSNTVWAYLHHLGHGQWGIFNSKRNRQNTDRIWLCQFVYLERPECLGFKWITDAVFPEDVKLQLVGDPTQWPDQPKRVDGLLSICNFWLSNWELGVLLMVAFVKTTVFRIVFLFHKHTFWGPRTRYRFMQMNLTQYSKLLWDVL